MTWRDMDMASPFPAVPELSPDDQASVEDCLDAAQAFADGALPFFEAAAIGRILDWRGVPSPAYSRYIALNVARKQDDPRKPAMMRLLDTLVRKEGYLVTDHGVFRPEELRANEAGWQHANFDRSAA